MKKQIVLIFFCILLLGSFSLSGCGVNATISSDYPYYSDIDSLLKEADIIIVGDIVKSNKAQKININADKEKAKLNREEDLEIYTVSDVKIKEVIKGDLKEGNSIKIKELGDKDGIADSEIVKNGGYLKDNTEHIFFLKSYENIIPGMPYSLLNPIQGRIGFVDDKAKVFSDNTLFKDSANKIDVLKEIKDKVKKNN